MMKDNSLKIAFDYTYPDEAAMVVYQTYGGSMFGGEPNVGIKKIIVGEEAVKLYSGLTGKSIEDIVKEAGYTRYDMSTEEYEGK